MPISVKPIHSQFAGEIAGVDLRQDVDAATVRHIVAALDQYAVVVLPGQDITDEQQIAFFEVSEDRCKIARLFDYWPGRRFQRSTHFVSDDI